MMDGDWLDTFMSGLTLIGVISLAIKAWKTVPTKADVTREVGAVEARMEKKHDELRGDIKDLRDELRTDIHRVADSVDALRTDRGGRGGRGGSARAA